MKLANIGANADTHEKLGKFVEKAQELQAKVEALEEVNKKLSEQLRFKGTVVRVAGSTYVDGDDEPICSRCAEIDNRAVHFVGGMMGIPIKCPQCRTEVNSARRRSQVKT